MLVTDMILECKFAYDKLDSLNYPDIQDNEWLLLLNKAQDTFVKQRYGYNNFTKQSFEEVQKRTEDLKNIVVTSTILPQALSTDNINVNARFFILPVDHYFTVQERVTITYPSCTNVSITEDVYTKAIQHDDYSRLIDNPFEKPSTEKCLRLMDNGKVEILYDPSVTLVNYKLRYIKEPVPMSLVPLVNCELSNHTHYEIINLTVSLAMEGTESKRLGTYKINDNTN
jgi:hypothetical protein